MRCQKRFAPALHNMSAPIRTISANFAAAVTIAAALFLTGCGNSTPDSVKAEDFYRGKNITIMVGFTAGGLYDVTARVVAQHLGKHIPGSPGIIVENKPGAGSLQAANYVYDVAPKDGTMIGLFIDSAPLAPLWGVKGARYDPREVGWLGALARRDTSVMIVRADAPATRMDMMQQREITLGSTGANSPTSIIPMLFNELVGTKFKVVTGYPGYTETMLAIERGEIHGRASVSWEALKSEHPDWIANRFIVPVAALTLEPIPELPDVPLALDFVKNEKDRELLRLIIANDRISHIFSVAPGVPPDRLALLRKAFADMARDPEFIAMMDKTSNEKLNVADGPAIETFVREAYKIPEDMRARAAKYAQGF